jgi:hypothetical protein
MIQPDVLVVLLDPGLSGMPSLSSVDLTTFTRDAVNAKCFEAEVILNGLQETGDLPRWEAYYYYVLSH